MFVDCLSTSEPFAPSFLVLYFLEISCKWVEPDNWGHFFLLKKKSLDGAEGSNWSLVGLTEPIGALVLFLDLTWQRCASSFNFNPSLISSDFSCL